MKRHSTWRSAVRGAAIVGVIWAPPILAQEGGAGQAPANDGGLADIRRTDGARGS